MATHARARPGLDLPRPWYAALPFVGLCVLALGFEIDPRLPWLTGIVAAVLFAAAGAVRGLAAHRELTAVRRTADKLIVHAPRTNDGVFTAFTLSQAGMVHYWLRTQRRPGWRPVVNGAGAAATGLVTLIVVYTKFAKGAWLVTVAIPLLVLVMLGVRRHYRRVARRLGAGAAAVLAAPPARNTTLLLVESLDEATEDALWFARASSDDDVHAVHVPTRSTDPGIRPRWFHLAGEPLQSRAGGSGCCTTSARSTSSGSSSSSRT